MSYCKNQTEHVCQKIKKETCFENFCCTMRIEVLYSISHIGGSKGLKQLNQIITAVSPKASHLRQHKCQDNCKGALRGRQGSPWSGVKAGSIEKRCMPLRITCTAKQSAKHAQARVRSLATRPTASVTSLKVVPAAFQRAGIHSSQ